MKTELILLGVIGVVFLLDFLLKGVKKKKLIDKLVEVDVEKSETQKQISTKPIYFLFAFVVSIIIGAIIGFLFDYFFNTPSYNSKGSLYSWSDYFFNDDFSYFTGSHFTKRGVLVNYIIGLLISTFFFLFPFLILKKILKVDSHLIKLLKFITKRKKNISLLIIIIPFLKVILHYLLYPIMKGGFSKFSRRNTNFVQPYRDTLGEHFDKLFEEELFLFVPAIIVPLIIIWFFNDKIKAR